jgi:hypothetical protein
VQKLRKVAGWLKKVATVSAIIVVAFTVVDLGAWLSGHTELAMAILVGVLMLVAFAVGNAWAAFLMFLTASVLIRSQESADRLDVAQIEAATGLVKEVLRYEEKAQGRQPTLPTPQQQSCWPALEGITEGEFEVRGDEQND